jgi:FAD/FMN-containing dehydrogenase
MSLTDPDSAFLEDLDAYLGPQGVRAGEDAAPYLAEQRDKWRGRAALVVRPGSTEEVAEVVRRCAAARVAILPYGGGTGLVGAQVMPEGPLPVVLSVERLNRIRDVRPEENSMIVEAGVILADVQAAAEKVDRLFPLSLASEGSCRIGGNLATNAGGVQVLRYGTTRDLVLGVEAVLPDGAIHHGLKTLRKDNTGYDLRHLLIGSEGTLGVITAASLKLVPRPAETATAFCAAPGPAAALGLLNHMRAHFEESVSSFELISGMAVGFVEAHIPGVRLPLASRTEWMVLTETGGPAGSNQRARMEAALEAAFEAGLISDAALAMSEAQREAFWKVRESIPEANRKVGAIASHDISVPISRVEEYVARGDAAMAEIDPSLRVSCFGHLGDGNLHYNVYPAEGRRNRDYAHLSAAITEAVHDLAYAMGGSCSAEHGIGRMKVADLEKYGDPAKLAAMRAIKDALDPFGIMNPGAVLRHVERRNDQGAR